MLYSRSYGCSILLLFGATQNCLCLVPRISCNDSVLFSALQFVPFETKVFCRKKNYDFLQRFLPPHFSI